MNSNLLISFLVLISISGCKVKFTPSKSRIYVVQEIKLGNNKSFFWFRDEKEIFHEGLSYFQIAKDKCELSVKSANAYCELPEQVLDFKNDTIFFLTRSDIVFIKTTEVLAIKAVGDNNNLYDNSKRPKREEMYFLDTVCR